MAVRVRNNRLYLDFYTYLPGGRRVRCFEATGLKSNDKNKKIAESKDKAIRYHTKNGSFNYLSFFPHGAKSKYFFNGSKMLFSEWWAQWIAEKTHKAQTIISRDYLYSNHIGPYFGAIPLGQIQEHDILVFRKVLEGKPLKASSINLIVHKYLCRSFHKAIKRGLITINPCEDIRKLKEARVDVDPLSFDELKHWLNRLEKKSPEWHDMILFWSRTGLRVGELIALKWEDLDYFNKKVMIRRSTRRDGVDDTVKTVRSERDISLRPQVMQAIQRQEARTGLSNSYIWQFKGKKWAHSTLRTRFMFYLRLAGLRQRSPGQMRHTFATLHIAAGEQPSYVSQTLGHSSVEITMRRYNRFIPNLTREDGSAFERVIKTKKGNIKGTSLISS